MFTKRLLAIKTGLSNKEISYFTQLGFLESKISYTPQDLTKLYKIIMLKSIGCSFTTIAKLSHTDDAHPWNTLLKEHLNYITSIYGRYNESVQFVETLLFITKNESVLNFSFIYDLFLYHFHRTPSAASHSRQYMRDSLRIYSGEPLNGSTKSLDHYEETRKTS